MTSGPLWTNSYSKFLYVTSHLILQFLEEIKFVWENLYDNIGKQWHPLGRLTWKGVDCLFFDDNNNDDDD